MVKKRNKIVVRWCVGETLSVVLKLKIWWRWLVLEFLFFVWSFAIISILTCCEFLFCTVIFQVDVFFPSLSHLHIKQSFCGGGGESSSLALQVYRSCTSTLQPCCLSARVLENRFYELALLWSLMGHKYPVAVFHGSIDLNLWVCIGPPVSHSQSPTAPLHFMATLPPDYVHRPVWIWLMAFMVLFYAFAQKIS